MTTKHFYTFQDYKANLKPGSFIYPYYDEFPRTSNRLGPRWCDNDPTIRKNKMISWNKSFDYLSDEHLRHWLKPNASLMTTSKYAKIFHVDFDELIDFFSKGPLPDDSSRPILAIYPKPLGIYLGEILQPTWENGKGLAGRYYVKVLTICGQIVWARA